MVRVKGLEPSRLAARASKTRVSASFTIPATIIMLPYINLFVNSFYGIDTIFLFYYFQQQSPPFRAIRKEGDIMSTYEEFMVILTVNLLIAAILNYKK